MKGRSHGTRNVVVVIAAVAAMPVLLAVGVAAIASGQLANDAAPARASSNDIPSGLVAWYSGAADTCPGLSWTVVAAIAKVETDHGRFGNASMTVNGDVRPRIIGIQLNGTAETVAIPDTDAGRHDGDPVWDRAVGPLQFIPSTWARFGVDANGDGTADPHNFFDAVHAAAGYLCANGAATPGSLRTAILAYNHAGWYADEVLSLANRYGESTAATGFSGGGYALPVGHELLTLDAVREPHHDYPAWDLPLPIGTPVYAVRGGSVTGVTNDGRCGHGVVITGGDGARYTYCHAVAVTVAPGQAVATGAVIMWSGNSGRSTGPHLHLQIESPAGRLVCPQPILGALYLARSDDPAAAPTTACTIQ